MMVDTTTTYLGGLMDAAVNNTQHQARSMGLDSSLGYDVGGENPQAAPFCVSLLDPQGSPGFSVFLNTIFGLSTLVFVGFLAWRLKTALRRLVRSQSQIMRVYYCFLWVVCFLNLCRFFFQIAESSTNGRHEKLWNGMWLLTMFGMTLMEVSVVTFLSQGYIATGKEALIRTLCISGFIALFDSIVKMSLIFGYDTSLFIYDTDVPNPLENDMSWAKWGFWTAHHLLYMTIYLFILILPHTHLRDYLPARPSFYRYVALLCGNNFGLVIGSVMVGSKDTAGYCVYGIFNLLYFSCYPVLLYMTFLSEFFVDDDLELEHAYYSEMREAGYFDDIDFQQ